MRKKERKNKEKKKERVIFYYLRNKTRISRKGESIYQKKSKGN